MNYNEALQILGVSNPPALNQVKKSYRQLALQYHPDRNSGNPAASDHFRTITEAYNFIVEFTEKWGEDGVPVARPLPSSASPVRVEDTADVFDDIFGFTREDRIMGYQFPQLLWLTQAELTRGAKKKIHLFSYEKCSSCLGSGSEGKRLATICTYCFGGGRITAGLEKKKKICPKCGGRGRQVKKPCARCNGFGRIGKKRRQEVDIPASLSAGKEYTLHARDLKTGKKLDVFVRAELKKPSFFTIENGNVLCNNPFTRLFAVFRRWLKQ